MLLTGKVLSCRGCEPGSADNPNAEQSAHMSKDNFIAYQAGQNGGQDFSRDLLSDIYAPALVS